MSAYDAYRLYNSLKLHFNSEEYNYFKYSGKIRSRFIPENQLYIFDKLYKMYGENLEKYYVANFLENPKIWVFDLLGEECRDAYNKFIKKNESLTYLFKSDIISLVEETDNINDVLRVREEFPPLLKRTLQKRINLETVIILNYFLDFISIWDKKLGEDLIWKNFKLKLIKYSPFVKFDENKFKSILKEEIKLHK